MSTAADTAGELTPSHTRSKRSLTRVAVATMAGTAIEAFDFLAYGTAAALVFNKLFFPTFDPVTGTLSAFGAFASGLFARPIGRTEEHTYEINSLMRRSFAVLCLK